ncbi:hypothetical protein ACH4FA_30655 [Streptomyces sp. NPDC017966]|uniref:hypothetical protein n=1 Tax=Streptomyces sp. NPDC017966 TaxID=3365023 RepID=UPI0037A36637
MPKDDTVAGIRALHNAARSAVKARIAALNQIGRLLITAPETIRAKYGRLRGTDSGVQYADTPNRDITPRSRSRRDPFVNLP